MFIFWGLVKAKGQLPDIRSYSDPATFTGTVLLYTTGNLLIRGAVYENGMIVGDLKPKEGAIGTVGMGANLLKSYVEVGEEEDVHCGKPECDPVTVTGHRPTPPPPFPLPPLPPVSPPSFPPAPPPPMGGGGGGGNGSASGMVATAPDNPITDIEKFLECFNSSKGASLTTYVDQPVLGTRAAYKETDVGHAFISIQQVNANGQNIVRTLGLYPKHSAKPYAPNDPYIFGNDASHVYDVKIEAYMAASLKLNYLDGF